jgi:hypothetical protein
LFVSKILLLEREFVKSWRRISRLRMLNAIEEDLFHQETLSCKCSRHFGRGLGIAFAKGKATAQVYGDEPVQGLLRMNACDAAELGRKIEVEGKR